MSISAVSFSSGSTGQTKKAGGGPPPDIQAELNKYGLQPTGSLEGDKAAIAAAKAQKQANGQNGINANQKNGKPAKPGGPGGPPPEIMAQLQALGLTPQGSLQADMAAINAAKSAQSGGNGSKLNFVA